MKTLLNGLLAGCILAPIFLAQIGPTAFAAKRQPAATAHFAFSPAAAVL